MDAGDHEPTPRATTLWRSFGHAWDGLVEAALGQRNMRIHLVAGVLAGSFAALAPLEPAERALLALCTALVVAAEAANTSLEALVDLLGGPPSERGRIAKDAAAGAVLALAAASVAVFALLAAGCWTELTASWRALLPPAAAGIALAGVTAALLTLGRLGGAWPLLLSAAGVILVTLLATSSASPACAFVPALLLAVAADAARRGGATHQR